MPDEPVVYIFTKAWSPEGSGIDLFASTLNRARVLFMLDRLALASTLEKEYGTNEVVEYDATGEFLQVLDPEDVIDDEDIAEEAVEILSTIWAGETRVLDSGIGAVIADSTEYVSITGMEWHYLGGDYARCEGNLDTGTVVSGMITAVALKEALTLLESQ